MKKILTVLLAASMIALTVLMTACGSEPEQTTTASQTTGTTQATETTGSETSASGTSATGTSATSASTGESSTTASSGSTQALTGKEKHPDFMDVNFGGREFHFAVAVGRQQDWDVYEIMAEATGNDNIITEAIIDRNSVVESLYNCKIKCTGTGFPENLVANDMQLGTSTYDFCMPMGRNAVANPSVYNLAALDMDLTHSWWNQDFIDTFGVTIDGTKRVYMTTGHFNLLAYDSTWALYFNKDVYDKVIASGKSDIDIYAEVKNGTWTADKMITLMDAAATDVNGDQTLNWDDGDIFGCVTYANLYMIPAIWRGFGIDSLATGEDGSLSPVSAANTDIALLSSKVDKAIELWGRSSMTTVTGTAALDALSNGQALFISECLALTNRGADENARYSIVPFPKYDEAQERYYQHVCDTVYGIQVSAATKDLNQAATFLEVFGYHSMMLLYPQYVTFLKTQCFCEDEAGEMLEIVFQNRVFDLGYYAKYELASRISTFISTEKNMLSKAIAGISRADEQKLSDYYNAFRKLEH